MIANWVWTAQNGYVVVSTRAQSVQNLQFQILPFFFSQVADPNNSYLTGTITVFISVWDGRKLKGL